MLRRRVAARARVGGGLSAGWWRRRAGGGGELVAAASWWRRRAGGGGELPARRPRRSCKAPEVEPEVDKVVVILYPGFKMRQPVQLEFPTYGGRRKGAGRPKGDRVSHDARPAFLRSTPAHVTLRIRDDVPSLRSSRRFAVIRRSFKALLERRAFRLMQFSVLSNHLHLIVEADDSVALSRGMQGLCIRLAKALNKALGRKGALFGDHYHSHLLRSPAEVANALAYVRTNAQRHYGEAGTDYFSSSHAAWLALLAAPVGWLLKDGWKMARRRRETVNI
jgi:putative transposase